MNLELVERLTSRGPRPVASKRVIYCDLLGLERLWVRLPEWVGEHASIREKVAKEARELGMGPDEEEVALALSVAESWGGLKGLAGKNPARWDWAKVDAIALTWFCNIVVGSFTSAYEVPESEGIEQ